jgi:hypothetical protein
MQPKVPIPREQRAAPAYPVKTSTQKRPAKKRPAKRLASRLRAVSDELGVTTPKPVRRSSAGVKQAPRAKPRKVR